MGLQFRHQQAKLYREVAMGEKHLLSITRGKYLYILSCIPALLNSSLFSLDMRPSVSNFLVTCLVGIYIFQFYNGYRLLALYFFSGVDCPHWQVSFTEPVCSSRRVHVY